jgi:type II secretory pathway predicted ATPase ExeA
MNLDDDDLDVPDDEDRRVQARRMFMYSMRALAAAAPVQKVFVGHPDFKDPLKGCDRAFQLSRALSVQQGLVLAGPTGVGKTALIRYFRDSLPRSSLFEPGLGALALRCPMRPTVGHFIGALLRQLKYPFPHVTSHTLYAKRDVLIEALRQKGTRLAFVDEAHHLRGQTRVRMRNLDGSSCTDLLLELMDEVPLAVCLCGNEQLLSLRDIDESLDGRVSARFQMRNFEMGGVWVGFLKAFRRQCAAFDIGLIEERDHVDRLHKATGGNPRAFKRLITEAVLVAVDAGSSALAGEHLQLAYARVHGGMPPAGGAYAA